ncbi:MAG: 5-(carboxyamino)imidazole ribonucleotide synthase [Cyanobacteria bacterium P01_A01_bin.84]
MKRIGVIGGGQLAQMMGEAAKNLDVDLIIQTPSQEDPAVSIADRTILAAVGDPHGTGLLANHCDVITFENEFVDLEALSSLAQQGVCFRPRLEALSPLLDKYHQRSYLQQLGLLVPKFIALESIDLTNDRNLTQLGFPVVLKARRNGYDGQGTDIIKDLEQLKATLALHTPEIAANTFLLEEFIPFEKELAAIATRGIDHHIAIYPIVETQQEEQVCRRAIAPADISADVNAKIQQVAQTLLNSLQVLGTFGIELFLTRDNQVLVNEIAPRTHNSGHFTIDACQTSQFEQHLRAVCGLPLGSTDMMYPVAVMVNLLGYEDSDSDYMQKRQQIAAIPQARIHWYGKTRSRPGRKLGHVTVLLEEQNRGEALLYGNKIESIWYPKF